MSRTNTHGTVLWSELKDFNATPAPTPNNKDKPRPRKARYFELYPDLAFVLFRAGAYGVPFRLGPGGQQDRPATRPRLPPPATQSSHSSPHPYGGVRKGNGAGHCHQRARCLQVVLECAPGLHLGHDLDCLVGKPSQVERSSQHPPGAHRLGRPLALDLGSTLCHRPLPPTLGPAPPETSEFFSES